MNESEIRAEVIDKLIETLKLYRNKEGYLKYALLYKILINFKNRDEEEEEVTR